MIEIKVNGKPFSAKTLEDEVILAMTQQLRDDLGSIRHPQTGEFPTIGVTGDSLDRLQVQVEGSPELLALVQERLKDDADQDAPGPETTEAGKLPKVFLSYAFDDSALASRIAGALQANGVETWFADWCISAGDSIRQRIDEGLGDCTHFVVLLTPRSIDKPWVRQEMDAGLMRKLSTGSKFIALRSDLPAGELPPLLQGGLSPSVDPASFDVTQLINDIHGVSRKPALGPAPAAVELARSTDTGFSAAATALAKLFVETTDYARTFEPHASLGDLCTELGLPEEDLVDAIHELKGLVTRQHDDFIFPEAELFVRFDQFWKGWNPADDALRVASGLVNDDKFPSRPAEIAGRFGWAPRRLNPALAYLTGRGLVRDIRALDNGPWFLVDMHRTEATRRFVKSRQ
ncbi:MAG: toll/interleukin-1 receptor domain-containing protein [Rubrivivax sp.]|nr:toll/interleukin-1 receptor domain-containing protein [Rubrivivax sp.]